MAIKDLQTKDVCEIIKTCHDNQVATLQWGPLSLSFAHHSKREEHPASPGEQTPPPLTAEQHTEANARAIEQDEVRLKEDRLANMAVEDPVGFEESMLEEEAFDEDDDDGLDESEGNE